MAIHRRFLYAGLFLVALGGVMVAVDLTSTDAGLVRPWLRLWPLAIVAIGLALVVRRTPAGLPAGILAAVAPGLLLGGSIVAGPRVGLECSERAAPPVSMQREGDLAPRAAVSLATGCGSTTISTATGAGWVVSAGTTDGRDPAVVADQQLLSVESAGRGGRQLVLGDRREAWDIVLPTVRIDQLALVANANEVDARLGGASLGAVVIEANASTIRLDATGATLDELDIELNFATATLVLPATRLLSGNLEVNAGVLRICQPAGSGMTVDLRGNGPREVTVGGMPLEANSWSGGNVLATNQIALSVEVAFGEVEINPIGGC